MKERNINYRPPVRGEMRPRLCLKARLTGGHTPLTPTIGAKGLSDGVGFAQTQNEEICLDRTVLSGIVVDAVAQSQELVFFLKNLE